MVNMPGIMLIWMASGMPLMLFLQMLGIILAYLQSLNTQNIGNTTL